jgi:hypothetical protein
MIKKKIVILSLVVVMLLSNVVFAAGAAGNKESAEAIPISSTITDQNKIDVVVAKEIKTEDELVTYNVQVPKVQGLKDAVYQEKLNNIILKKALKDIEEVEAQAKELAITAKKEGWEYRQHEIFIDFAIKSDDHILSFVINTYMYTGTKTPDTLSAIFCIGAFEPWASSTLPINIMKKTIAAMKRRWKRMKMQ